MMVRASAPGKIILFGEHFVVKGAPSIATAISRRVHVTIRDRQARVRVRSERAGVDVEVPPESLPRLSGTLAPLAGIVRFFLEEYGIRPRPFEAVIESEIPIGAGLGSSAAFSAAFSLAYAAFHGVRLTRAEVLRVSMIAERIAHGNPSGIDTTIAVHGGSIVYVRGRGAERVALRLPRGHSLVVANSGVERSTREVVERVLQRARATWTVSRHIYDAARSIVQEALGAFERGDALLLGELMDINHGLLNAMGASSVVLETLVHAARRAGAVGAKLTGAGWGGSVIALVPDEALPSVTRGLSEAGAREVFTVNLGCEGVRLEG